MNAQHLKNSILQEAIEGRLVPQDPNDEPASVLLDRIRKEKESLVKEGKLKKKDIEETPIKEDEIPFEIPKSWEWCRVSDISDSFIGLTYKPTDVSNNGWIVLRSSNIQEGHLDYNDIVKVNVDVSEKLRVRVNDIIICARNGSKKLVGKSALVREVNEPTTFGAFMAICRTQFYEYMAKYLLSPLFFQQLRKDSDTTTINQLTQKNFNRYLVPLPPLAEQKRIVAKIEELLPKVEEYGKAQEALNKLNEELPERLKKSILQEAIEGHLVPQDPNDEPASVLLERIRKEKARLVKEKKILLSKPEKACKIKEKGEYLLPQNWKWGMINDVCRVFGRIGFRGYTKEDLRYSKENAAISISPSNMVNGTMDYSNCTYISEEKYEESPEIKIHNGDILIVKTGSSYGKTSLVENLPWKSTINPQIAVVKDVTINKQFLVYFFQSPYAQSKFKEFVLGTSIPTFSQLNMISMQIPLPPLAEQKRIVEKIEQLFGEIDKLKGVI